MSDPITGTVAKKPRRPYPKRASGLTRQRKLTYEQREEIVRRRMAGENLSDLGREFGVSPSGLNNHLRKHPDWKPSTSRKKTLNELAFSEITDESAYWIGFIMADGHVSKQGYLSIGLSSIDHNHVVKFRDFLRSNHKITVRKNSSPGTSVSELNVRSLRMISDLSRFGVKNGKTHNAECLLLENNRHFWRGMVDGDGSMGIYPNSGTKKLYPRISLCGTPRVVSQFQSFCLRLAPYIKAKPISKGAIDVYTVAGASAVIISELYQNGDVSLDRKAVIAANIISRYGKARPTTGPDGLPSPYHQANA